MIGAIIAATMNSKMAVEQISPGPKYFSAEDQAQFVTNVKLLTCGLESEDLTGIEHDQGQEN